MKRFVRNRAGGNELLDLQIEGGSAANPYVFSGGVVQIYDITQNRIAGLATEANGGLIEIGANDSSNNRFGGAYASADQGGFLRFDTRAGEKLWSIYGRAAASTGGVAELLSGTSVGLVRFSQYGAGALTTDSSGNISATAYSDWTTYTPTYAAQNPGATPPTFTTNRAKWSRVAKRIHVIIDVTVSAQNTGSGGLTISLPVPAVADYCGALVGREVAAVGYLEGGMVGSTFGMFMTKYDGTTPIITGHRHVVDATYEAA